ESLRGGCRGGDGIRSRGSFGLEALGLDPRLLDLPRRLIDDALVLLEAGAGKVGLLDDLAPLTLGLIPRGQGTVVLALHALDLLAEPTDLDAGRGEPLGRGFGLDLDLLDLFLERRDELGLLLVQTGEALGAALESRAILIQAARPGGELVLFLG